MARTEIRGGDTNLTASGTPGRPAEGRRARIVASILLGWNWVSSTLQEEAFSSDIGEVVRENDRVHKRIKSLEAEMSEADVRYEAVHVELTAAEEHGAATGVALQRQLTLTREAVEAREAMEVASAAAAVVAATEEEKAKLVAAEVKRLNAAVGRLNENLEEMTERNKGNEDLVSGNPTPYSRHRCVPSRSMAVLLVAQIACHLIGRTEDEGEGVGRCRGARRGCDQRRGVEPEDRTGRKGGKENPG